MAGTPGNRSLRGDGTGLLRGHAGGLQTGQWLDPGIGKLLFLAYDLDRVALLLQDRTVRRLYDLDEAQVAQLVGDDEALLRFAFRYIRSQLEQLLGDPS